MKIDNYYVIEYNGYIGDNFERIKSIGKKKIGSYFDINSEFIFGTYNLGYEDIVFKRFIKTTMLINEYPLYLSEFLDAEEKSTRKIQKSRIPEIFLLLNRNNINDKVNEEKQKRLIPGN